LNSALDGGEWSASCTGRFIPRKKQPPVSIVIRGLVFSRQVWTLWRREKSFTSTGNRTPAVQQVACRRIDSCILALKGGEISERHATINRGQSDFPALNVPRQYPLVLLVEVCLREGEALGIEEGKVLGSGLCYEERREDERQLYLFI
jgi:hypothetical protein